MATLPSRGRLPTVFAVLIILTMAVLLATGFDDQGPRRPASRLASMPLAGDDADSALFAARHLAPGRPTTNCLTIVNGSEAGGTVRLTATDLSGGLVGHLRMRVEVGGGGRFGDCAGFSGVVVYDGPLTGLAADRSTTPGVSTGWSPDAGESRTYRITVEVPDDNALQHSSGGATLTWLRGSPVSATTPTPATGPGRQPSAPPGSPATSPPHQPGMPDTPEEQPPTSAAPAAPDPTSSASPAHVPSRGVSSHGASAGAVPTRTVGPTTSDPVRADDGSRPRSEAESGGVGGVLSRTARIALQLLSETARHPWYVLASLTAMWLFLFFADRSAKKDPKLTLAPMTRDPYLWFPPDQEDNDGEKH